MKKGILGAVAGLSMLGAAEATKAQNINQVDPETQKEITTALQDTRDDENTLRREITNHDLPPKTQALIHIATHIRKKIAEHAPKEEIQALFVKGEKAYQAARAEYKAKKSAGEDVTSLKKAIKANNTISMKIKRESLQKDEIIKQENEKQKQENEKQAQKDEVIRLQNQIIQRYEEQAQVGTTPKMIEKLKKITEQPGFRESEGIEQATYDDIRKTLTQN